MYVTSSNPFRSATARRYVGTLLTAGLLAAMSVPAHAAEAGDAAPAPRIIKVERTLCEGAVLGLSRDGTSYAWNCRGLPMIRLTLDDGTIVGPLIGVMLDTVGEAPSWQAIPVEILRTAWRAPERNAPSSAADARASDGFYSGPPFSMEDIMQRIGIIANKRLSMAVASRGLSFIPNDGDYARLKQAGATAEIITAVMLANRPPAR